MTKHREVIESADQGAITKGPRLTTQARGRATFEALMKAGSDLIERYTFEEITVAQIAKAAGCSVGTFYFRFVDKETFIRALIQRTVDENDAADELLYSIPCSPEEFGALLIQETIARYRQHKGLYRAAIKLAMTEPAIWAPYVKRGHRVADHLVARLGGRFEERRVRFAWQMISGTLNNMVVLDPGPLKIEHAALNEELTKAWLTLLGINSLA